MKQIPHTSLCCLVCGEEEKGGELTNVLISSILSSTVLDMIWCLNEKQWSETCESFTHGHT